MWFAPLFLCSNILRAWAVLSILSFLLPSSDLIHSRKICQAPLACSDTRHKLNFISWNSGTKASEKDNHDKHSRHTYLSAQQAAIIIYTCSSYQSSDIQTKIFQRLTFWKCCKPIPTIIIWKYIKYKERYLATNYMAPLFWYPSLNCSRNAGILKINTLKTFSVCLYCLSCVVISYVLGYV